MAMSKVIILACFLQLCHALSSTISVPERIQRSLTFYSRVLPLFSSYQLLKENLRLRREIFNEVIDEAEEERLWDEIHDWGSDAISNIITQLKGFYVKTGQVISTRVDIFPVQYTSKLAKLQDDLDPLPAEVVRHVISRDLLNGGPLTDLFLEFDDQPLGSASIAQVHRAKLLDGRVVAVKVQRPGVEGKLLGDIANIKAFVKLISNALPIDYYKVCCELERTLVDELDFFHEAVNTQKVAAAVAHTPSNAPRIPPVVVPQPIPGLVCKTVMVLEFIEGTALSRLALEMAKRGVERGSPESVFLGKKLLTALTDAYSSMIFGSGIIHGDPHPGNIFVMKDGDVALIDCGQVKQITNEIRIALAKLIVKVNDWEREYKRDNSSPAMSEMTSELARMVQSMGVVLQEGVSEDCAAAVAVLLFGNTEAVLPGGYAGEELSANSPINKVQEFSQEFVLLGRACVLIKGIANRLGVPWSLSDRWAIAAKEALESSSPVETGPVWSVSQATVFTPEQSLSSLVARQRRGDRVRFREIVNQFAVWSSLLRSYLTRKLYSFGVKYVPQPVLARIIR